MENIESIRQKISDCDSKIIEILTERMNYIEDIISYKKEHGLPILQEEIESQKEISLRNQICGNKFEDEILDVFRNIVYNGKKIQTKNLFEYNIFLIGFMGVGKKYSIFLSKPYVSYGRNRNRFIYSKKRRYANFRYI